MIKRYLGRLLDDSEVIHDNPIQSKSSRFAVVGTLVGLALGAAAFSGSNNSTSVNNNSVTSSASVASNLPKSYSKKTASKEAHRYKTTDFSSDSDEVLLARIIFGEAEKCSYLEKVAVGYTAVTRANDGLKWNGETLREVVLKQNKRGVHQYSCFNNGDPARKMLMNPENYDSESFNECLTVASEVLSREIPDPTNGADHYFNLVKIKSDKIKSTTRKYETQIRKLIGNKANAKKIKLLRKKLNEELERIEKTDLTPGWAKKMERIGKINAGDGRLSAHEFYKSKIIK